MDGALTQQQVLDEEAADEARAAGKE